MTTKVERRLAAILAADVARYSQLMGIDEIGTLAALKGHRRERIDPAIARHRGRIVKTTGDGLLAEFASVVDAVSCAVAIQRAMLAFNAGIHIDRQIVLRIGINIGDVIIDDTDIFGDGVNVAARLEALCEPGGICISRSANEQVRDRLALRFADLGEQTVKNIARAIGVFGLAAKDIAELPEEELPPAETTASVRPQRRNRLKVVAATAVVLAASILGAGGWWTFHGQTAASRSYTIGKLPRLSVAVLPFDNLGADAKDDHLADGITEDLTTDLSHIPDVFVVARDSARSYKGKAEDVRRIGAELGVRYVVNGSLQRLGDTLRVNARLTSTESGAQLWSDRFDEPIAERPAGQEQIVTRMQDELALSMFEIESSRSLRERPTSPDAFDLVLRARFLRYLPPSPQRDRDVVSLYEQAFAKDPTSLDAMTSIAYYLTDSNTYGWGSFQDMQRASHLLEQARTIAPDSKFVLNTYVYWLRTVGRCPEAIELAQQALKTDAGGTRPWTGIYNELSVCKIYTGDAEEGLTLQAEADRLNPLSSSKVFRYGQMGLAALMLGRDQDAIMYLERSLAISHEPAAVYTQLRCRYLAAAYARTGQLEEAGHYLSEADQLWPYDTVRGGPTFLLSSVYAEQFRRYRDALRLAGERDHVDEDVDFGVPADGVLHSEVAGRTPKEIRTTDLVPFLATTRPLVVDTVLYSWNRSISGAVGLQFAGLGGSFTDEAQDRLRGKMLKLAGGNPRRPIVTIGWNAEHFDGRNLALRLASLGYTNVYWYRGGREAWEVNGLPETNLDVQQW
jgi:adenylate cyclase